MPSVEIDGTNSTVKTNVLTSQSASAITVPTGKVLTVTDAAGLTVNGATPAATAAAAAAQYAIATQVPPSTSGKVLTSNGSAWTSATPAAGGGLIPITDGEVTASNDATISFGAGGNPGFTATYDNYLIQMDDIKNVTTNTMLRCRFLDSGGSVISRTNYKWAHRGFDTSGTERDYYQNPSPANYAKLVGPNMEATTGYYLHGNLWFYHPLGTGNTLCRVDTAHQSYIGYANVSHGIVYYQYNAVVSGIQIYSSSGNILSGKFSLYGLKKGF